MWPQLTHWVMTRGLSSAGRALPLQGRGQGFESPRLHKIRLKTATGLRLSPTLTFDYSTLAAGRASRHPRVHHRPTDQPDLMARFNKITRELQALLDQPNWSPDDKPLLSARINNRA